jgi:hypothetical protein
VNTPIVQFYDGRGRDQSGRSLAEILQWDDAALERVHDFIQWLFPLDEPSGANWQAPVLTASDIRAFADDAGLRAALRRSLVRMLAFYGLRLHDDPRQATIRPTVERADNWVERSRVWLTPMNHNHLRLTRMMKCLALLGLPEHARALRDALLREAALAGPAVVSAVTLQYWRAS